MASKRSRGRRDDAGSPEDRIRSIYAARSAASGRSSGAAARDDAPRGAGRPGEDILRKAFIARMHAGTRSK